MTKTISNEAFRGIENIPGVVIDLRYASTNNFTKTNIYGDFRTAYLHEIAYEKLVKAAQYLMNSHPRYKLIIFDALRPTRAQDILFSFVRGTDVELFVANPEEGSVHSYGFAVDLSVLDPEGRELDMGSEFDDFSEISAPRSEVRFVHENLLRPEHLVHRRILREPMEAAGFIQNPIEWWHFDAMSLDDIKTIHRPFNDR